MDKNTHLTHFEDLAFIPGGVTLAKSIIRAILSNPQQVSVFVKYDGAPAIVYGVNPENGQFFIGTKSALNKKPILCYSLIDIDDHYRNQMELRDVLRVCFIYLRGSTNGIYQADVMHTHRRTEFQPNVVKYQIEERFLRHDEEVGLAIHTAYTGATMAELKAKPVFNPYTTRHKFNGVKFYHEMINSTIRLDDVLDRVLRNYGDLVEVPLPKEPNSGEIMLSKIINRRVRDRVELNTVGAGLYYDVSAFIYNEAEKRTTDQGKQRFFNLLREWDYTLSITVSKNFNALLSIRRALLGEYDARPRALQERVGDEPVGEGYVLHCGDHSVKLVHREIFSPLSLNSERFSK